MRRIEQAVLGAHPLAKQQYERAKTDDQRIQVIRSFVPDEAQLEYERAVKTYEALISHRVGPSPPFDR
jgi:hypothetical protein